MTEWKEIQGQVLASTQLDSQRERHTKESLLSLRKSFSRRQRLPLYQQHDASLDSVGYIENFRVVPTDSRETEWHLIGDVYFHDVELDEALRGFSYSVTEDLQGDFSSKEVGVYVPYPFYQDNDFLRNLARTSEGIVAGAWRKKAADPGDISLIVSLLLFTASPAYANFWNNKISPLLRELVDNVKTGKSVEYVQTSKGNLGETYGIYFIPPRGTDSKYLTLSLVMDGIHLAEEYIRHDSLAQSKGVYLVKLEYSQAKSAYQLASVEYSDGSVLKH